MVQAYASNACLQAALIVPHWLNVQSVTQPKTTFWWLVQTHVKNALLLAVLTVNLSHSAQYVTSPTITF
jgi:hypothetical protein